LRRRRAPRRGAAGGRRGRLLTRGDVAAAGAQRAPIGGARA